jgi:uncharacterized protein YcfJ
MASKEASMNAMLRSVVGAVGVAVAAHAAASITFLEREDFSGRSFTTEQQVNNLERFGFNNRASSAIVDGGRWEVCDQARFGGRCVVLRPGRYDSLHAMGLDDAATSVRAVPRNARYNAPPPAHVSQGYDYRRRNGERLYQAEVTSVRAVVGPPEQHCWVEREQVVQNRGGEINVPGAIAGAVIGGILGHQIGGGRGQDIATAGGAVGGAALGANIGRSGGGQQVVGQDVQRCAAVSGDPNPDYWDVTYRFRGQQGRVYLTNAPGPTITVNERGEPRV